MHLMGLDIGGTSVRAVVTDESGRLLGRGRAAGANIRSSDDPAGHVAQAATAALAAAGLPGVAAVGAGSAGAGPGGHALVAEMLDLALGPLGLPRPALVEDSAIAFGAASPTPEGVLLLAGTGSAAVRYADWLEEHRCDGMGWLLGDEGSGVWLGRRVLRAAAADLDGRGAATQLTGLVLGALGVPEAGDPRQPLIAAATPLPPAAWARFAPLALGLDGADTVATALLDEAAARLIALADAVGAGREIVLAGGLVSRGPLRARLSTRFVARFAAFPVVGACRLAAEAAGVPFDREALTAALAACPEH